VAGALRLLLEETGHRVSVAGCVADAVAAAAADPPDVLLLDLTLPDGDGLAVLAGLRDRGAPPRTAVAMTGHDDAATRDRCLAAGCRDVLVKPVPTRELLRKVAGWVESG
jgi:CheY-like chemotaxis protein